MQSLMELGALRLNPGPAGVVDEVHAPADVVQQAQREGDEERGLGEALGHRLVHQTLRGKHGLRQRFRVLGRVNGFDCHDSLMSS